MTLKRSLSFTYIMIVILCWSLTNIQVFGTIMGDVNGDGSCNSLDLAQFRLYSLGSSLPYSNAGDINGDGAINSVDYEYMHQYVLEIIPDFLFVQTKESISTPTPVPSAYPTSATKPTVYIAGDSTVQTYEPLYSPLAGWGQMISKYFTSDVKFVNNAMGGRSSGNFVTEGRLDKILNTIQRGDYLFVQFGHNDAASNNIDCFTDPFTSYKEYLSKYIDGAREKDAIPVLITPAAQLNYSAGTYFSDFEYYCYAMKQVAYEKDCAIIDLMTKCLDYYSTFDYDEVYKFYMVSSNGTDYIHFTEKGATELARLVSQGVKELDIPISKCVK